MIAHSKPGPTCDCPACGLCEMIYPTEMVITFDCDCDVCRREREGGGEVTVTPVE